MTVIYIRPYKDIKLYDHAHIRNVRNPVITFPRTFFLQPIRGRLSLLPLLKPTEVLTKIFPFLETL